MDSDGSTTPDIGGEAVLASPGRYRANPLLLSRGYLNMISSGRKSVMRTVQCVTLSGNAKDGLGLHTI